MIKKKGGKWVVLSEKTGRSFGSYDTKAEAEKRLRQVEFLQAREGAGPAHAALGLSARVHGR